ncbi:DHA2 family efflux MFS transporter permease subunit [Bdellovibrio sp. HCB274]|uniref:DHA2 family efflux MFS transporter permease subunit n=1 Tax=Bdellovibrio sp. HCB274 TaxID=3394361 RepID=UPI0039B6D845
MTTKSRLVILVAVMASLLEIIDSSIVNVALPTMMGNLGATLEDISMVITGYAIANAIVLPVSAWLGNRVGRRKYFLSCIGLFTITSVACGFAPNLYALIFFRILQGLAGGALLPTSQTLIYEQFPKEKAGTAGAIFGMSVMIGPTLGPTLGGWLTDTFGWRSIFNVNLPLGLIAIAIGLMAIENPPFATGASEGKKPFDVWGLVLLVLGIGSLQYMLERGESNDWFDSKLIVFCGIMTVVSLPLFVWWETKVKAPIMNVRLFLNGIVANGAALQAILGFFLYGLVFILPVFVGQTFHFDATQTGMLFIPGSILTAMMMPFVGKMLGKGVNPKYLIAFGFLGVMTCIYMFTTLSPLSSKGDVLAGLYIRGLAMAFLFVPINSSILSQFNGIAMGEVSGILNLFRQIGGSMGIAFIGTMMTSASKQHYADMAPHVTLLDHNTWTAYNTAKSGAHMSHSMGMATQTELAIRSLYGRVQSQVFMLTFHEIMFVVMFVVLLAFIPLYLLKFKNRTVKVVDAH